MRQAVLTVGNLSAWGWPSFLPSFLPHLFVCLSVSLCLSVSRANGLQKGNQYFKKKTWREGIN